MSLNKVMIIGNLGRDPEMRYTPSGLPVTQFSVAVNRNTRDDSGEWKKETEWFRIVLFRDQAERAAEWLRKGTKVYIEGRLQTRQYEKDGQTHYMTEVIAERFANLDPRQRDEDIDAALVPNRPTQAPAPSQSQPQPQSQSQGRDRFDDADLDDLPF